MKLQTNNIILARFDGRKDCKYRDSYSPAKFFLKH